MGNREHSSNLYNAAAAAINAMDNPNRLATAYQLFCAAVYADPTFGTAAYQCGNNASDLNYLNAAVACYRRALECKNSKEETAKILCNLGWRLHSLGHTQEALDASLKALELDPSIVHSWLNLSLIYGILGQSAEGVRCGRKAFELAPKDATVQMALAFALLFDNQIAEGLHHFEARFEYKLKVFKSYPYPRWDGAAGKTVFLVADQGLGDTLAFSRFVEETSKRCKYIHACVQPELMRAFTHAFMHLQNINWMPAPAQFPPADAWSTFFSLPAALSLNDQEIRAAKNIAMPVFSLPKTWKVPDRKFHIGIAWRGSAANDINEHRSIPVTQFLDLYKVPGIQLYSLQVDANKQQLLDQGCSPLIRDLSVYISDVTDTVSLLQELDLVITIESALGHICAMVNKECWVPYSYGGRDFRIGLDGSKRLWCPNHRIFSQGQFEPWAKVFERINEALMERVHDRNSSLL